MLLLAHGGAGNRKADKKALNKLSNYLKIGYGILRRKGTVLDAVVEMPNMMLSNVGAKRLQMWRALNPSENRIRGRSTDGEK